MTPRTNSFLSERRCLCFLWLCVQRSSWAWVPSLPLRSTTVGLSSATANVFFPESSATYSAGSNKRSSSATLNQQALDSRKFPRTWVPLASTYETDPDRPSPVEFLGQKYVCYRDNNQQWVVMDDSCPHRLVPLSEGRINRASNSLQCSYHGWEFNSNGDCIRIPQAAPDIEQTAMSSKRSCVASYPVHIEKNVIWFWPWKEDVLSIAGEPSKHPEGLLTSANLNPSTYTRDLPYGWESLVENLIDPSHVPFAHHGLQGKREDAIPINMTIPESMGELGFRFEWQDRTMGMLRSGFGAFQAPYTVMYDAKYAADTPRDFKLSVLCIPTKPGWSRAIILGSSVEKAESDNDKKSNTQDSPNLKESQQQLQKKKSFSLIGMIFKRIPVWLVHQLSNRFLDSDLAFLHYQEHERQRNGSYYMPAPSDRCIAALRSWVPKYTDMVEEKLPPALLRSQMFDRWSQHTSKCVHCQRGLKTLETIRRSAYAILCVSVLGIHYTAAKILSLLCLGALLFTSRIERSFKEGGFRHYDNH